MTIRCGSIPVFGVKLLRPVLECISIDQMDDSEFICQSGAGLDPMYAGD